MFLSNEFSRVSNRVAHEVCVAAGLPEDLRVRDLAMEQKKALVDAFQKVKIMAPDPECLSPIGPTLIKKGLKNVLDAFRPDVYLQPETREPRVYGGNPFLVEVGMVYGGNLPAEEQVQILRFANRVPLLYEQGSCVMTAAVEEVDWRRYGLDQRGGKGIPVGPAVILVHVACTKLPFTSEAKVAISNIDEMREDITLALKACARRLKSHLVKKKRREQSSEKFTIVREVLPMMAEMSSKVLSRPVPDISKSMTKIMNIVLVEDLLEFKQGRHEVKVNVYNYTPKRQRLTVHVVLPETGKREYSTCRPSMEERTRAEFEIEVKPVESKSVCISLSGLQKEDYTENEVYVSGIDPACLVGAEPPSGEWGIESLEMVESEHEAEGDGPDLDEVAASDINNGAENGGKYSGGGKDE
jgi:DNA topoisomerase-6 subunit B